VYITIESCNKIDIIKKYIKDNSKQMLSNYFYK